ncbi:hypothetical protein EZS27_028502, partial [termite gut metagenome]
ATNLLPQFQRERTFDYAKAVDGMRQMLWGFFKKMVVADNCAMAVNSIWTSYQGESGSQLLLVAVLFTFQIYGDFSGYSDIAIGCARLFGIELKRNFNFPYFSRDIAEFWRRWHISLTTWFRDYIYIPLGGSRVGKWKSFRNTMVIFLVSGFWYGANWTFVMWGAYHALLFLPLLLFGKNRKYKNTVAAGRLLPSFKEIVQMLLTFLLIVIGWVIFRAENIAQTWDYLCRMFSPSLFTLPDRGRSSIVYIIILLTVEWFQRDKQHALQIDKIHHKYIRWSIYYILAIIILSLTGQQTDFIYFQF